MKIYKFGLSLLGFIIIAADANANTVTMGSTLPINCSTGDYATVTTIPSMEFECVGTNTWRPKTSDIIAIRKGIDINSANTDFAVFLPSTKYFPRSILVTGASKNLSASTARIGLWTLPGGTGVNVVAASLLTSLTTSSTVATVNFSTSATSSLTVVYVRCTVADGSAATVDVYIKGDILP